MKRALVTGACGQDGYYLVRYLRSLGYDVWAGVRHSTQHLVEAGARTIFMDLRDLMSVSLAIRRSDPDEIYNLAGQSFVPPSWQRADYTLDVNTSGLVRILETVLEFNKKIKVYQASSSEMFGNRQGSSDEDTPMLPTSPYGVSKLAAHRLCSVFRQKGLFVCGGICFNHESPRRGEEMVTRKIVKKVAQWKRGDTTPLRMGSTAAHRDWGFAGDYVKAMHTMLQLEVPEDFVIATGWVHCIQEFLDLACEYAGVKCEVEVDPRFLRTGEIHVHKGNASKARRTFGFEASTSFEELVRMMVDAELASNPDISEHHVLELESEKEGGGLYASVHPSTVAGT